MMNATPDASHPSASQLHDFVAGRLDARDAHWVERHLPHCPECLGRIESVADVNADAADPLLALLRDAAPDDPAETSTARVDFVPHALRDHARYRIIRRLGDGGMGAVFLAEHRLLERLVVIKVIRPDLVQTPELLKRFQREARLAAKLAHSNVVAVYEAEQIGPTALLVMEYVAGETFAELVRRRGPTPLAVACELIRRAAHGLQHVFEQGLVHRDIKPSNLILTPGGEVKVMDLGLAFLTICDDDSIRDLTRPEQSIGTVDYTAPEQWEDCHAVDIRADVYSLGCTFFYLLNGHAPYAASDGRRTALVRQLWAHSTAPVPDVRVERPDVPAAIGAILQRMLAKKADDRFAVPADVAAALEPFAGDSPAAYIATPGTPRPVRATAVGAAAVGTPAVAATPSQPSRRAILVGSAVAAIAGGGAFLFRRFGNTGPRSVAAAATAPSGPPIRVGVLHSLSGTMAISERPVVDATLLAIDELNAAGGLLGRPIEAVVADGASEGAIFASEAERLIAAEHVVTVFGCWTSASRRTVRPVFEKHNHLLFYPVQYEGLEQSPNIIYTGAAPNQQILPAVRWCSTVLDKRRFFLVGSDYVFPRCANAIIHDCAAALGAEIVGEAYLPLGGQDASEIVGQIASAKPDMILNTINGDSNVAFYRALRELRGGSLELPVMSFSIAEEELRSLNARDVAGDYAAWNYFMSIDRAQNHLFVRKFQDRYGAHRVLTDPMEAAYFGVHLWAKAVAAAGSADIAAIHRSIGGQTMEAPEGPVTVDPATKHTFKTVRIGKIVDSASFEVIYTSENPIAPVPYPATRTPAEWQKLLDGMYANRGDNWARPVGNAAVTARP